MKRPGFLAFILTALCGCIAGWSISAAIDTRPSHDPGPLDIRSKAGNHQRPTARPDTRPVEQAYFRIYLAGLPPSVVASALHRGLFKEIEGLPVGGYCYCEMLTLAVADAAKKNPMAIFDGLVASRGGRVDELLMAGLFETWTADAPQAAIDAVQGLPQSPRKDTLKNALINALSSTHPQLAMTLYRESGTIGQQFGGVHFHTLFSKLAKTDPSAARREFSTMRPGPDHATAARALATAMAAENTQAATQWAEGLPDPEEKQTAFCDIFREAIRQDPTSAETLLARIDNPAIRSSALISSFEYLMNQDPAFVDHLTDETLTGATLHTMRSNLIGMIQDPAHFPLATDILQKQPAGKNRDSLIASFAENFGTLSPQQTRDWLTAEHEWERLPEETRTKITERLANGNRADTVKW